MGKVEKAKTGDLGVNVSGSAWAGHTIKGEQRVTVQHVDVSDGGQAIVGKLKNGGRGGDE